MPPDEPRIVIAGDWHSNAPFAIKVIHRARLCGAQAVIQAGDMGCHWPGDKSGYVDRVANATREFETPVYYIDGNHDNHSLYKELVAEHGWEKPIKVGPKDAELYYLPRGCRFELNGIKIGALGGAHSVDWRFRIPGVSWWPDDEMPTPEDVEHLGTEPLDVLIIHDAPEQLWIYEGQRLPFIDEDKNAVCRRLVAKAIRNTKPKKVFHGHHHIAYENEYIWFDPTTSEEYTTRVYGLAHDAPPLKDNVKVLNTDTFLVSSDPLFEGP